MAVQPSEKPKTEKAPSKTHIHVAPSPHLSNPATSTNWMMYDVVIGLAPVIVMSVIFFQWNAVWQISLCVFSCLVFEEIFSRMHGKPANLLDGSALVTGIILALSLPWSANYYVAIVGSAVAIGMGKTVFGGLGFNLFNPAMVGRAFVMLSFPKETGAAAYMDSGRITEIVSQATPLTAAKAHAGDLPSLWPLLVGAHNGSLGETSVLACLIGGLYLCFRRSASWEIPVGIFLSVVVLGLGAEIVGMTPLTGLQQICTGALFLGAFFIATDPVSSPVTPKGKFIFGFGVGAFTVLIRLFSGYPEGVMFAVLLMNAAVPLIDRWMIPAPLGGVPKPKQA